MVETLAESTPAVLRDYPLIVVAFIVGVLTLIYIVRSMK